MSEPTAVEQKLVALGERLDALEDTVRDHVNANHEIPRPAWLWQTLNGWVEDWFVDHYARTNGIRWCAQWWQHPEAVSRLHALWTSWETAQRNPDTGMAHWYVHFADPIVHELTHTYGTFVSCDHDGHRTPPSLKSDPVPPGFNLEP